MCRKINLSFLLANILFVVFICCLLCVHYYAKSPKLTSFRQQNFQFDVTKAVKSENESIYCGKNGGLDFAPAVCLGDKIKHEDQIVGTVTELNWDRARHSLEIKFVSEANIHIGQQVHIELK